MKTSIFSIILKQLLLWGLSTVLLIIIIFIPRDVIFETSKYGDIQNVVYHYSIENHIENIKSFFHYVKENKGLGEYASGESVGAHVFEASIRSLKLIIPAILLGFFLGIVKGVFDFLTKRKKIGVGSGMTWFMLSVPDLFFMVFSQLALMFLYEKGLFPHIDLFGHEKAENQIVAIVFLAMYPLFFIANITYTSLLEEESMDYIPTAKSKGVGSFKILSVHMLKNALQKINVSSNTMTLYVLSNLFIVEFLTNYRGAAYYFFSSIATPSSFRVGQSFFINLNIAFGFVLLFTFIIFLSNAFFQTINSFVTPKGKDI
ncbi:ABC transporter permease subunit [Fredinandcohnia sp. SECRCQ15]|uniref:ABC transporter permease subunit n=2 Tax=Fredinandcohnia quinoae TaxID=2918902 RepID=A0AAW5E0R7_9BACI|nr:ABC transporter permease subunit [Fredinandcohnia sp. SECRCQ15]